jgi:hypothetical protein
MEQFSKYMWMFHCPPQVFLATTFLGTKNGHLQLVQDINERLVLLNGKGANTVLATERAKCGLRLLLMLR